MKSKIQAEHQLIDELFDQTRDAFELAQDGAGNSGGARLEELCDAVAALGEELGLHFEQEEELYFPALTSLRGEFAEELAGFEERHRRFRLSLEALAGQLERRNLDIARASFESLAESFRLHEDAEEAVLKKIEEAGAHAT